MTDYTANLLRSKEPSGSSEAWIQAAVPAAGQRRQEQPV